MTKPSKETKTNEKSNLAAGDSDANPDSKLRHSFDLMCMLLAGAYVLHAWFGFGVASLVLANVGLLIFAAGLYAKVEPPAKSQANEMSSQQTAVFIPASFLILAFNLYWAYESKVYATVVAQAGLCFLISMWTAENDATKNQNSKAVRDSARDNEADVGFGFAALFAIIDVLLFVEWSTLGRIVLYGLGGWVVLVGLLISGEKKPVATGLFVVACVLGWWFRAEVKEYSVLAYDKIVAMQGPSEEEIQKRKALQAERDLQNAKIERLSQEIARLQHETELQQLKDQHNEVVMDLKATLSEEQTAKANETTELRRQLREAEQRAAVLASNSNQSATRSRCKACKGKGEIKNTCYVCNGATEIRCQYSFVSETKANFAGFKTKLCDVKCNGGKLYVTKKYSGYNNPWSVGKFFNDCPNCGRDGKLPCKTCRTTGAVTTDCSVCGGDGIIGD